MRGLKPGWGLRLNAAIAEKEAKIASLEKEVAALKDGEYWNNQERRLQAQESRAEKAEAKLEAHECCECCEDGNGVPATCSVRQAIWMDRANKAEAELAELRTQLKDWDKKLAEKNVALEARNAEIGSLKESAAEFEMKWFTEKSRADKAEVRLIEANARLGGLAIHDECATRIIGLSHLAEAAESQVKALQERVKEAEAKRATINGLAAQREVDLAQMKKALLEVHDAVAPLVAKHTVMLAVCDLAVRAKEAVFDDPGDAVRWGEAVNDYSEKKL